MAPKPEHKPEYRSMRERLKRAWSKAGGAIDSSEIGHATSTYLKTSALFWRSDNTYAEDEITRAFGFSFGLIGLAGLGLATALPDKTIVTDIHYPPADEQAVFTPDLSENGYVAFSNDGGETGYALFNYDGDYRLYNVETSGDRHVMTYVSDADEAWYRAEKLGDAFTNLSDVAAGHDVELTADNWEVFEFGEVQSYISDPVTGSVIQRRAEGGVTEHDYTASGDTRLMHYQSMQEVWDMAADHFQDGYAGISNEEFAVRAGELTRTQREVDSSADEVSLAIGGGLLGGGILLIGLGGIGPTRRKLAREKRYMPL